MLWDAMNLLLLYLPLYLMFSDCVEVLGNFTKQNLRGRMGP